MCGETRGWTRKRCITVSGEQVMADYLFKNEIQPLNSKLKTLLLCLKIETSKQVAQILFEGVYANAGRQYSPK